MELRDSLDASHLASRDFAHSLRELGPERRRTTVSQSELRTVGLTGLATS